MYVASHALSGSLLFAWSWILVFGWHFQLGPWSVFFCLPLFSPNITCPGFLSHRICYMALHWNKIEAVSFSPSPFSDLVFKKSLYNLVWNGVLDSICTVFVLFFLNVNILNHLETKFDNAFTNDGSYDLLSSCILSQNNFKALWFYVLTLLLCMTFCFFLLKP